MMLKKTGTCFLVLMLCSALFADDPGVKKVSDYIRSAVQERKLSNGITLLMVNRGYAPTLAFEISFRVGSADESYDTIGAAHMLEHMLFKGTSRLGTRNYTKEKPVLRRIQALGETIDRLSLENPENTRLESLKKELSNLQKEEAKYVVSSPYDLIYSSSGGVGFNASTARDKTGYYIELPSTKLELWAKIESERLKDPVFREYYLERNNVIEERKMRYDSSGTGGLYEIFLATAFSSHPYRHPTIGWKSNIPFLSLKKIKEFYRTYYIPSNMTITIVGKQDVDETYRVINKYFGDIPAKPRPGKISISEVTQKGEKRFRYIFEANPAVVIGWHKPTFPSREDYIMDIFAEIVAGGKSSPMYRELVQEKQIATSVSAWNGSPGARYNNLFVVFATPASGHSSEECENEIYHVMNRVVDSLEQEDLERAINRMEANLVFDLDNNKGIAHLLSYYQTVLGNWRYVPGYLEVIRSISLEEIKKTATGYIIKENRTVGILEDARQKEKN